MNASNPFQIPVCLQRADSQQRRRERFKRGFIAVLAAIVVLLVGALIEGCMSEQTAGTSQTASSTVTDFPTATPSQPAVEVSPSSNPASQANLNTAHKPVAVAVTDQPAPAGHAATVYVIKPGDTLTRIAKTHGTTVKALKAANSLENDRIVVGTKLKIPEA